MTLSIAKVPNAHAKMMISNNLGDKALRKALLFIIRQHLDGKIVEENISLPQYSVVIANSLL